MQTLHNETEMCDGVLVCRKPASVVPEYKKRAVVVWGTLLLAIVGCECRLFVSSNFPFCYEPAATGIYVLRMVATFREESTDARPCIGLVYQ